MDNLNNLISRRFFDDISSIITTGQHQAYALLPVKQQLQLIGTLGDALLKKNSKEKFGLNMAQN